jgi:putative ABC transport system permease protein
LSGLSGPAALPGLCAPGTVTQPGALSASSELTICNDGLYGTDTVLDPIGGPTVLKELTGIGDANADAALNEGGAVVFEPGLVQNGKATFAFEHAFENKAKPGTKTPTTTYVTKYYTVPAVYENPQGIPNPGVVVSPALAQRMGASTEGTSSLVMDLSSHITPTQDYGAGLALNAVGNQSGLSVEDGYIGRYGLANLAVLAIALLLAIGAAAIATGLALADGRADHETLTAVGGSPWTRRWLAGSTALVITGLGIVIGVPIGFLIAEGLVRVSNLGQVAPQPDAAAKAFIVPWLNLGVLVIAVPVLTALGAMLLARSRAPRIGRIEF